MPGTPHGEGRFVPEDAFKEPTEEKHARLEPAPRHKLSGRTRRALDKGKGFVGKDLRGEISDERSSEAARETKDLEDSYIERIDREKQGERITPQLEALLDVFGELDPSVQQGIIKDIEAIERAPSNKELLEHRLDVVDGWAEKLQAQGLLKEKKAELIQAMQDEEDERVYKEITALLREIEEHEKEQERHESTEMHLDKAELHPRHSWEARIFERKYRGRSHDTHGKRGRQPLSPKGEESIRLLRALGSGMR